MPRFAVHLATAATVAVAATATVLVSPAPGGAAAGCVAYAAAPRVLHTHVRTPVTLRLTLRGTAGCRGVAFDNGAIAYLVSPSGRQSTELLWNHFDTTVTQQLYTGLNESGTWRIVNGRTETYDAESVRIPSHWTTTTVRIVPARRR